MNLLYQEKICQNIHLTNIKKKKNLYKVEGKIKISEINRMPEKQISD